MPASRLLLPLIVLVTVSTPVALAGVDTFVAGEVYADANANGERDAGEL